MLQDEQNEPLIAPPEPPSEFPPPGVYRDAALEKLTEEFRELRDLVTERLAGGSPSEPGPSSNEPAGESQDGSLLTETLRQLDESAEENARLRDQIDELNSRLGELEQQNGDLASQLAGSNIRQSVAEEHTNSTAALSWEQRKAMILQQMESESFDAEAFAQQLNSEPSSEDAVLDPAGYVEQLHQEMQRRDEEINELRCLLEQQGGTREGGVAIGAAAIAEMVDSDELVQEERQRLQQLQVEWEEKFRQGEIAASLERAKLSRERQELARKNEELEEQLAHLRRECRDADQQTQSPSRRWLAKLGLSDAEE